MPQRPALVTGGDAEAGAAGPVVLARTFALAGVMTAAPPSWRIGRSVSRQPSPSRCQCVSARASSLTARCSAVASPESGPVDLPTLADRRVDNLASGRPDATAAREERPPCVVRGRRLEADARCADGCREVQIIQSITSAHCTYRRPVPPSISARGMCVAGLLGEEEALRGCRRGPGQPVKGSWPKPPTPRGRPG